MTKLAIIGGGPAGYVAAEKAAKAGLSVVLFEKEELGGVCLNEGCIPTKTLLYSAKIYDYSKHGDRYGVNFEGATLDFPAVMKRKEKVVKKLVGGIKVRMRNAAVEVVKGDAMINGPVAGGFSVTCGETTYEAEKLLICTGSSAVVPPIPGVSGNMGYGNLMAGYVILEPKSPEDGFQEVEVYPDSLGTPLAAPTDGYKPGVFEMMFREDRSSRSGEGVRLIAFRHKTSAGFVYGVVKMNGRFCNNLEYIVNSVAGEQSLEAEERRWSSFR